MELFWPHRYCSHTETGYYSYTLEFKKRHTLTMNVCVSVSMVSETKVKGVNRVMKDTGHKGAISFQGISVKVMREVAYHMDVKPFGSQD